MLIALDDIYSAITTMDMGPGPRTKPQGAVGRGLGHPAPWALGGPGSMSIMENIFEQKGTIGNQYAFDRQSIGNQ